MFTINLAVRRMIAITCANTRYGIYPGNTKYSANAGLMLGQFCRRWPNINPALAELQPLNYSIG